MDLGSPEGDCGAHPVIRFDVAFDTVEAIAEKTRKIIRSNTTSVELMLWRIWVVIKEVRYRDITSCGVCDCRTAQKETNPHTATFIEPLELVLCEQGLLEERT